jgi:inhibitor of KinA
MIWSSTMSARLLANWARRSQSKVCTLLKTLTTRSDRLPKRDHTANTRRVCAGIPTICHASLASAGPPLAEVASTAIRVVPVGDTAYLVEFSDQVMLRNRLLEFRKSVESAAIPGVIESVLGLRSVLVHFAPERVGGVDIKCELETLARAIDTSRCKLFEGRSWQIPTCYESELALDLDDVARQCGLTNSDVVRLHSARTHMVCMIGFMPGQPYLSELPRELQLPRRPTPRTSVPQGSVAIATNMTVIYPTECPAGWHVIGRTPAPLFSLDESPPAKLMPGDSVQFVPISRSHYDELEKAVQRGDRLLLAGTSAP